jgi:putative GTP pyrophosphokinase
LDEIVFILKTKIESSNIKLHGIEHRVKKLESIIRKCETKGCASPFEEFDDIVGARVICLFKNDIERVGEIIKSNFQIEKVDDKRQGDSAPLEYLSVHYTCLLPDRYKGPRYEGTAGIKFEIQVRTLCQHCWAQVSHHLDYKGDWDVPTSLKLSLSALSGLFYVADNQFEQFYEARLVSKRNAEDAASSVLDGTREINFDTVSALLKSKFPNRKHPDDDRDKRDKSEFVQELKEAGYHTLAEVEADIDFGLPAFEQYEKETSRVGYFSGTGVARGSLYIASKEHWARNSKGKIGEFVQFVESAHSKKGFRRN